VQSSLEWAWVFRSRVGVGCSGEGQYFFGGVHDRGIFHFSIGKACRINAVEPRIRISYELVGFNVSMHASRGCEPQEDAVGCWTVREDVFSYDTIANVRG
jgi:hypothetical protein